MAQQPAPALLTYRRLSTIIVYIYAFSIVSAYSVKLSIEKSFIQQTTVKQIDPLGVETFDKFPYGLQKEYDTDFGNSSYKGTYHHVRLQYRNYFGGASGKGLYPVATEENFYRLRITQVAPAGLNYFGLWISSFDDDNRLEFYCKDQRVYALNTQEINNLIGGTLNLYWGNPTYFFYIPVYRFVFVNFFFGNDTFDEVRFIARGHRFESDNHSVGHYTVKAGEEIPGQTTVSPKAPAATVPTAPAATVPPKPQKPTAPPVQITEPARTNENIILISILVAFVVATLVCLLFYRHRAIQRANAAAAGAKDFEAPTEEGGAPEAEAGEREKRASVAASWFP